LFSLRQRCTIGRPNAVSAITSTAKIASSAIQLVSAGERDERGQERRDSGPEQIGRAARHFGDEQDEAKDQPVLRAEFDRKVISVSMRSM
jgi:hypothetical protein